MYRYNIDVCSTSRMHVMIVPDKYYETLLGAQWRIP